MSGSRVSGGTIAVAALIAAAAAARLMSGNALLHTDLVYSPSREERIPGAASPECAAISFYLYIDAGKYGEAYEISLEPTWVKGVSEDEGKGTAVFAGWTTREGFVDRLNRELGPGGSQIRLGSVRAGPPVPFERSDDKYDGSRGAPADAILSGISQLEGLYRVRVSGHMLGACSVFKWRKDLTVVKSAGHYRVLLDGTGGGRGFSYRSWFENIEKLSDLRGGGGSRVLQ
jgi:hypothetical protein